jgi:HEAT repeat protein
VSNAVLNPIEYTLKVWSAFSGDILGADGSSAIEAYIRRMTSQVKDGRQGLERFALQLLIEMKLSADPHASGRILSEYEAVIKPSDNEHPPEDTNEDQAQSGKSAQTKEFTGADILASAGFFVSYPGSQFGFLHPIVCGYLAGKALSETNLITRVQAQPSWTGRNLAMYYFARYGDVTPQIQYFLQDDDLLHTNHLLVARWLQVAPKNRPWRTIILRTLATILQKEKDTLSLAAKIVTAMAFSGDEGVSLFFRQLLKSDHPNLRQLGALGCGILADKKAIEELNFMLQEQSPGSVRTASLALAAIADKQSLEILATSLLNGTELMRRCAAEALANNQKEGHPALQDGSTMEDLLVRRSVVFGLIRVNQPWARKIVENLQLEDGEWVVRNAAIQAFDELHRKANLAPQSMIDLTEASWLVAYASKVGTTVAPGRPAEELVFKVLQNGDLDEKMNAIDYLRNKSDPESMDMVFDAYKASTGELHDAAYQTLWLMRLAGIKLPYTFD